MNEQLFLVTSKALKPNPPAPFPLPYKGMWVLKPLDLSGRGIEAGLIVYFATFQISSYRD